MYNLQSGDEQGLSHHTFVSASDERKRTHAQFERMKNQSFVAGNFRTQAAHLGIGYGIWNGKHNAGHSLRCLN
jgi:hypothetical protein